MPNKTSLTKEEQLAYELESIDTRTLALLEEFNKIKKEIESLRDLENVDREKALRLRQRLKDNISNREALDVEYRDAFKHYNGVR